LHWPVPASKITFVEKLKASGYWTAQAGKWHLGDALTDRFDYLAAEAVDNLHVKSGSAEQIKVPDGSGAQHWLSTIRKHPKDKPFFLWLAAMDPHRPYNNKAPKLHTIADVVLPPYVPDTREVREDFVSYYNEISRLDSYVGEVMTELKAEGIEQNTIVVFMSDNGRAFPREKTTLYKEGIQTPLIVRWAGHIKPGTVSNALISSIDLAPTFMSLADLEADKVFLGENLSSVFTDPAKEVRTYVYAEDHWHDFEDFGRSVRNKKYSYIRNFYSDLPETPPADAFLGGAFQQMLKMKAEGKLTDSIMTFFSRPKPPEQLFDLENDPFELHNLINDSKYSKIAGLMRHQLEVYRKKTDDVVPSARTPDEFDRNTGLPLPNRKMPRIPKPVASKN
jgi:arylsulfatase A-like enzyme